ncbi:MAG: hypothetical protein QM756_11770 [Polyangiaceae bacterium]
MNIKRRILAYAVGLSIAVSPLSASAQERIPEEARAYFRNGVELLQSEPPNYQDAYYQFKLAFEKSNSWKVLGNLGLCAVKLERDGEALAFYDDYLKRGGKGINKDEREAIERDMLLIRGNTASVELGSNPEDADVLDVRSGATAPGQTYTISPAKKVLLLRAGNHTLTATSKEGRQLRWEVALTPGRTASHVFDFAAPEPVKPVEATPAVGPVTPPPNQPPPPVTDHGSGGIGTLRVVGIVTTGVGLALVGGGFMTGAKVNSKKKEADALCNMNTCDPRADTLYDEADSLATTANILFISGGAVAAVGIGLIIFGGPSSSGPAQASAKPFRVTPLLGSGVGGLMASGSF